jgi:hypothetical protein
MHACKLNGGVSDRNRIQMLRVLRLAAVMHGRRTQYLTSTEVHQEFARETNFDICARTVARDLDFLMALGVIEKRQGVRNVDGRHGNKSVIEWRWITNASLFLQGQMNLAKGQPI